MILLHFLIYLVTSLAVGITLIGLTAGFLPLDTFITYVKEVMLVGPVQKVVWMMVGIVILLSCLSFIRRMGKSDRREKLVTRQTSEGNVSITLSAIEDMIKKTLEEKKEISHVKPRVKCTRKGINVKVKGSLREEVNLLDFTSLVQKLIKKKLTYLLGEEEQLKVNIEIKKLAFPTFQETEEEEPKVPFRNY